VAALDLSHLQPVLAAVLSAVPFIAVALVAITFHEAAHAITAAACGDDTARNLGRASLNPIRHIDLFGTILLPLFLYLVHSPFLIGWAKPVPVNWSNLRYWRRDMMLVAAAGPAANFALAGVSSAAMIAALRFGWTPVWLTQTLVASVALNLVLGVFNLIPIPPLDGSKVLAGFLPEKWALRIAGLRRRRQGLNWHTAVFREGIPPKPPADLGV
jgi:Zn-dependent protease